MRGFEPVEFSLVYSSSHSKCTCACGLVTGQLRAVVTAMISIVRLLAVVAKAPLASVAVDYECP